jgi:hypothetical protein
MSVSALRTSATPEQCAPVWDRSGSHEFWNSDLHNVSALRTSATPEQCAPVWARSGSHFFWNCDGKLKSWFKRVSRKICAVLASRRASGFYERLCSAHERDSRTMRPGLGSLWVARILELRWRKKNPGFSESRKKSAPGSHPAGPRDFMSVSALRTSATPEQCAPVWDRSGSNEFWNSDLHNVSALRTSATPEQCAPVWARSGSHFFWNCDGKIKIRVLASLAKNLRRARIPPGFGIL